MENLVPNEINYLEIASKVVLTHDVKDIPDFIEYWYNVSPLKGTSYFRRLSNSIKLHLGDENKIDNYKESNIKAKIGIDFCAQRIKEIEDTPKLKEIYFKKGVLATLLSVVVGCILTGWIT